MNRQQRPAKAFAKSPREAGVRVIRCRSVAAIGNALKCSSALPNERIRQCRDQHPLAATCTITMQCVDTAWEVETLSSKAEHEQDSQVSRSFLRAGHTFTTSVLKQHSVLASCDPRTARFLRLTADHEPTTDATGRQGSHRPEGDRKFERVAARCSNQPNSPLDEPAGFAEAELSANAKPAPCPLPPDT